MDSNDKKIFARYTQIADILGQMFPNILEITIHSFKDLDRAVIHIVNGHITGRKVGCPASELNMRRLLEEGEFPDVIINFSSRNSRGQQLKSSSLSIRNDEGKIIGAICFHFDVSQFEKIQKILEHLTNSKVPSFLGINDFAASQPHSLEIREEIDDWLLQRSLYASQLTYKNKREIVRYLNGRGCFKKKGAIPCVANALHLTRQSIYNYIEFSKKSKNDSLSELSNKTKENHGQK